MFSDEKSQSIPLFQNIAINYSSGSDLAAGIASNLAPFMAFYLRNDD
jgi:hypothetical protein|tara:strand:- start:83 stop:223 length:141 start_codon:yes stop_codon:yes gene_type:complete